MNRAPVKRIYFRAMRRLVPAILMPLGILGCHATQASVGEEDTIAVAARWIADRPPVLEVTIPESGGGNGLRVQAGGAEIRGVFELDPARDGMKSATVRLPEDGGEGSVRVALPGPIGRDRWIPIAPSQAASGAVSPDWAKGIVWYQLFPERFRNGNPLNDPHGWSRTVIAWDAPFHDASLEEIEMVWNRRVVDPARFRNDPGRWWGSVGQAMYERRYGGDLQGVVAALDDLAELGVTGLYLCPVFDAESLHKYEASDHRHVDPTLGDPGRPGPVDRSGEDPLDETTWAWEPGDRYLIGVLLPEARKRGMRVILDGVWNHVGREHFAFRDVIEHGARSRYADWFKAEFNDDGDLIGYDAWDRRNGALPEFRQTPEGDLAPGPKAHVAAVTRRWMDPNGDGDPSDGVDGWRLDVAPEVGRAFWRDWRTLVRSINPDAVLVGEIWTDAALWFDGVAFDAQMNYPLAMAIADWLSIGRAATTDAVLAERIRGVFSHDPANDLAQMNLIASHDTERGASLMANPGERQFDSGAQPWVDGSGYDAGPPDAEAKRRLMLAYAMLAVLPGSPMVYNGDELALPGADDPDNRRPMAWPGLVPSADTPDTAFRSDLRGVLGWRNDPRWSETLRFGTLRVEALAGGGLVIRRRLGEVVVELAVARDGRPGLDRDGATLDPGGREGGWRVVPGTGGGAWFRGSGGPGTR
jgi:cyclomaltodextrinase